MRDPVHHSQPYPSQELADREHGQVPEKKQALEVVKGKKTEVEDSSALGQGDPVL